MKKSALLQNKNSGAAHSPETPVMEHPPASLALFPTSRGLFVTVTLATFLAYLRTLAPGLTFGDGPELVTASYVLGIPHPTGYPLYMILLHLWMLIPLGEPMLMGNLFSAVAGAIAAGFTAVFFHRLLVSMFPEWPRKSLLVSAAAGAMSMAFLKMIWDNATVAEVYALHMVFALGFLLAAQSFERAHHPRTFLLAALWLGLGLAHHRLSIGFALPLALMSFCAWRRWERRTAIRTFALAAAIVAAAQLFYLYIPIRAAAQPPINWSNCVTWENFLKHINGSEYLGQRFMRLAPGLPIMLGPWLRHELLVLWELVGDLAAQAFPVHLHEYILLENRQYFRPSEPAFATGLTVLFIGAYGFFYWFRHQRFSAMAAALIAAMNFAVVLLYNIADVGDYTLFPFWFLYLSAFIGIMPGCVRLARLFLPKGIAPRAEYAYALCSVPAALFLMNLKQCDQSRNDEPELYSYFVLPMRTSDMPENSILLTSADYDIFCSWYRQLVRRERTDVFVFGANFIGSPWYESFFTPEQRRKYSIKMHHRIPRSAEEYAEALHEGILKHNVGRFPVFTTLNDPYVIDILSKYYEFKKIGAKFFRPRDILGLKSTHIWEIRPKATGAAKP